MKKILLILTMAMVLLLSACGGEKEEVNGPYKMSDEFINLPIEEYVELCELIPYKRMFHEINTNEGAKVVYTAKIEKVIFEDAEKPCEYILSIIEDDDSENLEYYEMFDYSSEDYAYALFIQDGETKLLEGDYMVIYGEVYGTTEIEFESGKTQEVPEIHLANITLLNE